MTYSGDYDMEDFDAANEFEAKGFDQMQPQAAEPPGFLLLELCPPHASIRGTIRPIESCPICLRNQRDELINALIGISAVTGWHLEADEHISFTPQGLVDLNRNLEIAKQLIGDAGLRDALASRLRSTVTLAVYGLEPGYGSARETLEQMSKEINRRLLEEA